MGSMPLAWAALVRVSNATLGIVDVERFHTAICEGGLLGVRCRESSLDRTMCICSSRVMAHAHRACENQQFKECYTVWGGDILI